ncbi:nickel-dependent lactate racemase [Rubripirellula amarantea]|uniref:LarA-like N-terminal domain-containing protein n=1 Tax=Rubripirellula amarantea TaxID=2527999 RepID=A0A5C5WV52_9BACT|nr:lactate racemase domain-containing protein [Rubripirellula amarantea]MDA8745600.1 nickel-dependent lactate racemase [Rubripirellula amarantea]TWT54139.1 hypothetical protein Pla22_17740 [Rubripirellula amarantea]
MNTSDATIRFPKVFRVRQDLFERPLPDVPKSVADTIEQSQLLEAIKPGQRVAIAVGSRGIANLPQIVRQVVDCVVAAGGTPFIVPAMGSHGGATAQGQTEILNSLSINPQTMNCEIHSSMETISLGQTDEGFDIRFDEFAANADQIIVVNRVKPHTRITGTLQSGLVKMLLIGLGKQAGASAYHEVMGRYHYRLENMAVPIVKHIVRELPILMGLAVIEDAADQTSHVEAVAGKDWLAREPELLAMATMQMPRLPFDEIDLLIIDRIGKEISGTGMDTNVIGRKSNDNIADANEWPKVKQIYVRSLSPKTAGNAAGIGIAEYCHRRVVNELDENKTRINCITSDHVTAGRIPLTFDSDLEVFEAAVSQMNSRPPSEIKWVSIRDTLSLGEMICSEALLEQAQQSSQLDPITPLYPLSFNDEGDARLLD